MSIVASGEYCSVVWCSAADLHLRLLNRAVRGISFSAGAVLQCNICHRRSVAVLFMLFKSRSNPLQPLCCAMPVLVTRGALVVHRYSYATPRFGTSKRLLYTLLIIPCLVSPWNDLGDRVFDCVGPVGLKSRVNIS